MKKKTVFHLQLARPFMAFSNFISKTQQTFSCNLKMFPFSYQVYCFWWSPCFCLANKRMKTNQRLYSIETFCWIYLLLKNMHTIFCLFYLQFQNLRPSTSYPMKKLKSSTLFSFNFASVSPLASSFFFRLWFIFLPTGNHCILNTDATVFMALLAFFCCLIFFSFFNARKLHKCFNQRLNECWWIEQTTICMNFVRKVFIAMILMNRKDCLKKPKWHSWNDFRWSHAAATAMKKWGEPKRNLGENFHKNAKLWL